MERLPIDEVLPELRAHLRARHSVVLQAPPGAGKTTGVPPALLAEPWLKGRRIVMLEPRRLAARAVASRMAQQLGEAVGQTVGYRVRFDSKVSRATRIEVVTEGILTRRLQNDPELEGIGLVVFDEFHERNLHGDLALALALDVQRALREDLRLLVMSATLDAQPVASLLEAPVVTSAARAYPVSLRYLPSDRAGSLPGLVRDAVLQALAEQRGDILVFLPGAGEILRVRDELEARVPGETVAIHTLFADMPLQAQQQALRTDAQGRRKVILATTIAETSLTVEGVSVVVDGGWTRVPRFDARSGLTRLETVRVSQASADQRAGRAGRLGPGFCYRLWSEATQRGLVRQNLPEIQTADLSALALELALWGVEDARTLPWLEPPPEGALAQGRGLLKDLGALDGEGRLTSLGREMAALAVHPRLARMLVEARRQGALRLACDLAALLEERDIFRGPGRSPDLADRLEALEGFRRMGRQGAEAWGADPGALGRSQRAAERWRRMAAADDDSGETPKLTVGALLAVAYPDRIARRRDGGGGRFLLASGRGARLEAEAPLAREELLVAPLLDGAGDEARIHLAAAVSLAELHRLFGAGLAWQHRVAWDERTQAVIARRERRLGALVLESGPLATPHGGEVVRALMQGVAAAGLEVLGWCDTARQLQARILFLKAHFPEQDWPDVSDEALRRDLAVWLPPYLPGLTRRDQLEEAVRMGDVLRGMLGWEGQRLLDEGAPTHVAVPSGSRLRLDYRLGESPVLAVKLQEMFGQTQTPRVGWGQVPVTLHLLSPARRPIQVTQDLAGFWQRTYAQVRKELKGRYPKHPWPEDPHTAQATARAKPRRVPD